MASLFSSKKYTGIYIGSNKVVIAQVYRGFKGVQLEQIAEKQIMFESDASKDVKTSSYVDALKSLLSEHKFQVDNVILILPSKEIMVRYFTLPKVAKNEIASAVRFEAKKYVPFNLDEMISDYYVISYGSVKSDMEVLFAAAKDTLIQEYLSILSMCNINPMSIKLSSLSLINTVYHYQRSAKLKKSVYYLMLDVNENVATITFFRDGVPSLIRDFSLAETKSQEAILSDEDYENFSHELHLTLEYFYRQFPSSSITEALLFDDGTFRNKVNNLNSDFNIAITQPDLLASLLKRGEDVKISPQGILAISGAAEGCLKSKVDIDLKISEKEKEREKASVVQTLFQKPSISLRPIVIEIMTLLIASLILYTVLGRRVMATLDEQINNVKFDRAKINPAFVNLSIKDLARKLEDVVQKEGILSFLLNDRVYLTNKLSRVVIGLPEGVWLESLRYSNVPNAKEITKKNLEIYINGMVYSESEDTMNIIDKFIKDLRNDIVFMTGLSNLELSSVRKGEIRDFLVTSFKIKCY